MTEALSADEMSALYQKMQASPALYGDDMHRLMHTAQQVEGRAANLFTRLCAAETAIEQLQRTRNVMEPAPVRFDFEAENLRQQEAMTTPDTTRAPAEAAPAAPDALAHARAEGIREAAQLLRSTAKDHEGETDATT